MQLSVIRSRLRRKVGNPPEADVSNAVLNEHINDAYRDIATKMPHHKARKLCEFDTVADQDSYGLPSVLGALFAVWDTTSAKKLNKKGVRWYASLEDNTTTDAPLYYVRFRNYVTFVPTPDAVYTMKIFYLETITDLSANGDIPVIPATWHPGIWMLAKWYYYDDVGDIPKATYALESYRTWLSDKPSEIDLESVDIEEGVELPTLTNQDARLDFEHSP